MSATLRPLASLACGLLFGFGLALSGMLDPTRVRGFLDIFGAWDPSLAFVLGGAVATFFIGFRLSRTRPPLLADRYDLSATKKIDVRLVGGAAIFGVGWGMAGLCPGPAIAGLSLGLLPIVAFASAMVGGMLLHRLVTGEVRPAAKVPS